MNINRLYSVVVITFGSDPNNPSSNPGATFFRFFFVKMYEIVKEAVWQFGQE